MLVEPDPQTRAVRSIVRVYARLATRSHRSLARTRSGYPGGKRCHRRHVGFRREFREDDRVSGEERKKATASKACGLVEARSDTSHGRPVPWQNFRRTADPIDFPERRGTGAPLYSRSTRGVNKQGNSPPASLFRVPRLPVSARRTGETCACHLAGTNERHLFTCFFFTRAPRLLRALVVLPFRREVAMTETNRIKMRASRFERRDALLGVIDRSVREMRDCSILWKARFFDHRHFA